MTILAIATSTLHGSLAFLRDQQVVYEKNWSQLGSHSETLTPAIAEGLIHTQMKLEQIDSIGIDVGPGSFTGIRVGVNAVRSLGFVFRTPLFGFSSLLIMAEAIGLRDRPIVSLIDAQRNQFYLGAYHWVSDRWVTLTEPRIISSLDQVLEIQEQPFYLGAESNLLSPSLLAQLQSRGATFFPVRPSALALARLVQTHSSNTTPLVWNQLAPLYLRYSAAEENLKS